MAKKKVRYNNKSRLAWIKHRVGSGDDQDVSEAVLLFGPVGYYVFFRTLEIMGQEFNLKTPGYNRFSFDFFLQKFSKVSANKIKNILKHFQNRKRIFFKIRGNGKGRYIQLNSPTLKTDCDEYTDKLLRKISRQNPDKCRDKVPPKEEEEETDKDKDKKKRGFLQKEFDLFYSTYPNKKEKKAALSRWKTLCKSGELPTVKIIVEAVLKQTKWRKNADGEFRPDWKNPATWLNKGCWDDELQAKPESEPKQKALTPKEQRAELDRDE